MRKTADDTNVNFGCDITVGMAHRPMSVTINHRCETHFTTVLKYHNQSSWSKYDSRKIQEVVKLIIVFNIF